MDNNHTSQAGLKTWLVIFILVCAFSAKGQYEKKFSFNGVVSVLAETYDGALLVEEDPNTPTGPVLLLKYTLEGKELWRKQFDNTLWITGATATADSGFIVASVMEPPYANTANFDTTGDIALIKFDKCANMQWARYIPGHGSEPVNVVENNHNFFLVGMYIASDDQNHRKPITILKFNREGSLITYNYYEGDYSVLYTNPNTDTLYLMQDLSIALPGDTGLFYLFAGISALDTNTNRLERLVIGYKDSIYNEYGPLIIGSNKIRALTQARPVSTAPPIMFSDWTKSLRPPVGDTEFRYDIVPNWNIYPYDASFFHDTIVTFNSLLDSIGEIYASMRLYDTSYKMIKESVINNHNYTEFPNSYLNLSNNHFIATTQYGPNNYSNSFYLFDSKLNPLSWPTVPPAKGYDWACKTSIPTFQEIDPNKVCTRVYVAKDTSRPNWTFLSVNEPAAQATNAGGGWLAWPQPASPGGSFNLYSGALSHGIANNMPIEIIFYDCLGKKVSSVRAVQNGKGQFYIRSLPISVPGLYLAVPTGYNSAVQMGSFKVMVK